VIRVDRDDRVRRVLASGLREAGPHLQGDHLDRVRPATADLTEEPVRGGAVVALSAPHDLATDVVGNQREVVVLAPPADLVHADLEEVLEPVGIELVRGNALDDPPDGAPSRS
jgi:hypothetical protein